MAAMPIYRGHCANASLLRSRQLFQDVLHDLRCFRRQTRDGFFAAQTFEDVLQPFADSADFGRLPIVLHDLRELIRLLACLRVGTSGR